jgi:hypothetical protein
MTTSQKHKNNNSYQKSRLPVMLVRQKYERRGSLTLHLLATQKGQMPKFLQVYVNLYDMLASVVHAKRHVIRYIRIISRK